LRLAAVKYLVDPNGGTWANLFTRENLGFFSLDQETGKEIIPSNYDPEQNYNYDNFLYLANLSFVLF